MSAVTSYFPPATSWRSRSAARLLSAPMLAGLVLVSRLIGVGGGAAGELTVWRAGWRSSDPSRVSASLGSVGNALGGSLVRWDSIHYLQIAAHGYTQFVNTSFFPLYPLLTAGLGAVVGSDVLAGVLISLAAFAVGLVLLHRLTSLELGPGAADATVLLLAFAPLSFFFSAVYTESLFLALSVGCVYAARRERWAIAALLAAAAALTRNTGVLLVAPVGLMYIRQHGIRSRGLLWLALPFAAVFGYLFYLHTQGWGWTAPLSSERAYLHQGISPWGSLEQAISGAVGGLSAVGHGYKAFAPQNGGVFLPGIEDLILLVVLALACWMLVKTWRELPAPYFLYALLVLAMCISSPVRTDPLRSLDRYILTIFPLWMAAGAWVSRGRGLRTVLVLGALLMAFYSYEFATWAFVA